MRSDEPTREPVVARSSDRFLGLTKMGWVVIFVSLLIILIATLGTVYATKIGENHDQIDSNQKQIERIKSLVIQGKKSHDALCAFTKDLSATIVTEKASLARSKKLVHKNPNIIPGVTSAQWEQNFKIQQGTIDRQGRTVMVISKSLGSCPKVIDGAKKN